MRVVLAFSGGLDTTFCAAHLRNERDAEVVSVFVNTGGTTREGAERIARQARRAGVTEHREIDARRAVWDSQISYLIRGNVLRGEVYPMSVAAERTRQAIEVAKIARELGADAIAHGSTGAGNDQVRFDIAFRCLLPDMPLITPVRELGLTREQEQDYLREHGIPLPAGADRYSENRGMWGTTLGGGWTHDPWSAPPEDARPTVDLAPGPEAVDLALGWERGLPVSLDGEPLEGPELVEEMSARLRPFGVGWATHLGETVLGIKGRIGFEAGAALVLISAHRELEKLVLTRWQAFWKDHAARFYGDRLHEGQYFDPVMRDIEAMVTNSQRYVTGDTRIRVDPGRFLVTGVRSPHSLMDPEIARYGETHALWTGEEARAFAKIAAIPGQLALRREETPPWS